MQDKLCRTVKLTAMILIVMGAVMAATPESTNNGGNPSEGVASIATGSDSSIDGFLSLAPDEYGHWASTTYSGGGDMFNPTGASGPLEAAYTSALFLFVPSRSQRTVLTENTSHIGIASDGSLTLSVTSPSVSSDANGDSVQDTLNSAFVAMGTDTNLSFALTQTVVSGPPGVANVMQTYVITNNAGVAIDFNLARVFDGDLLWDGDFGNDQVGTSINAFGGPLFVFEQEASDPTATSVTLSSAQAITYFGGKNGVQPAGGPPPYNFGTDTEIYDNFGVPASWFDHIAGVGYTIDGVSGTAPAGSVSPEDAFIGLGFNISLAPSESTTITITHTYGQSSPILVFPVPSLGPMGLWIFVGVISVFALIVMRRRRSAA